VPARRPALAEQQLAGIERVEIDEFHLDDLDSVAAFATRVLGSGRSIDMLIASAGIMACPLTRVGPGWEAQFATNHLGHVALVARLWPALASGGGARVVMVSSGAHRLTGIRWDDVHFTAGGYERFVAYGQSKTANVLFAVHLDALGRGQGVRAFSLHPGAILTPLQRHLTVAEMAELGWVDADGRPADPSFKTPEQGAATQVWAATSPQLDGLGGLYLEDVEVAPLHAGPGTPGVAPHAVDPAEAERLWHLSQELTGTPELAA
jgi:NAD(P)-dependent dehydrogenase (short-subunit alcohol dehydrogenase family)